MKRLNTAALATACVFGVLGAGASGHAALLSLSNAVPLIVDGVSGSRSVSFATAGTILDVNVAIDFIKCQGNLPSPLPADCGSNSGPANAKEISIRLTSPLGTIVDLVLPDFTYFPSPLDGPAPGMRILVTFSDDPVNPGNPVPGPVGGATGTDFSSGTFQPGGLLSTFNTQNVQGLWTLSIEDMAGGDALGVAGFRLDITVQDPGRAPVPATALLLSLGLAGFAASRRRLH